MSTPSEPRPSSRRSLALRDALALIGGLGVGVIAALGIGWARDRNGEEVIAYSPDERVVSIGAVGDLEPGAPSPREAIDRFLAAEVDGDVEGSLAMLSASDRVEIPTVNSWERTRRSRIGQIVGFSPIELEADEAGSTATASTTLELVASLDPVNGLTPPSITAEWLLVDDGGWRVDLGASALTPDYLHSLDPAGAEASALDWLATGSACNPHDAAGVRAAFRGSSPNLTDELCARTTGGAEVMVGPLTQLGSAAAASGLTASFGSSIRDWAAVVPVFEPTAVDLVLAPVGDRWIVIDVLAR